MILNLKMIVDFSSHIYNMSLPKRAFVTFASKIYSELALKLAESISLFSQYKLIIYTYNYDLQTNLPNVIIRQLKGENIQSPQFLQFYNDKNNIGIVDRNDPNTYITLIKKFDVILDCLNNGLQEGLFLDCDGIVRNNIDEIFYHLTNIDDYPLATKGLFEYMMLNDKGNPFIGDTLEKDLMDLLKVKNRSMHYVQSGFFLFNINCLNFFQECREIAYKEEIIKNHIKYAPYHDETIMNIILWSKNANKQLPLSYYNIGIINDLYNFYSADNKEHYVNDCVWHKIPEDKNLVKYFHGCKSIEELNDCIFYIKNKELYKTKIINITPGILPIPPNGWGAVEKIIWEYHQNFLKLGFDSQIKYLDEVIYDQNTIVHIHIANLALLAKERGIPYYFTCHDHHAFLYGKNSECFKQNYEAIKHSIKSFVPAKYLVDYFNLSNLFYLSHGVNTELFEPSIKYNGTHKLLCVANNGFLHDQSEDRKGFSYAIEAAISLDLPITIAGPKNNKNFFDKNKYNYNKLNILYDLTEEQLINLYQDHTIFIHASNLEAGHPNLTLLEALSCGLPIVATFEDNNDLFGLIKINRSVESVKEGVLTAIKNFDFYKKEIAANISKKSWIYILFNLITHYNNKSQMKDQLIEIYKNTVIDYKPIKKQKNSFHLSFENGCKLEIIGNLSKKYNVKFFNDDNNELYFESHIINNMWTSPNHKYFVNWRVEVYDEFSDLIFKDKLCLRHKRVKIINESPSLGDFISWMPFVEEFRKKYDCVIDFFTPNKNLFNKTYPEINFKDYGLSNQIYYASYSIGCFDPLDRSLSPKDYRKQNLQEIAANILGIEYKEIKPKLNYNSKESLIDSKYVCISTASTSGCKHWQNENGWQKTVNYLNDLGYKIIVLQKEPLNYMDLKGLKNIIHPETKSLDEVINYLKYCEFYIGLSSGISWLAWALDKKVVMISGFTEEFNEFYTPYRLINKNVCNGCWNNSEIIFDKGDWNWCPNHKNTEKQFECSKNITFEHVKNMINKILTNQNFYKNFDSNVYDEIFIHNQYELFQKVQLNDTVLDLGCSKGYFYFKNKHKNINYIGVDGSIDCLNDFKINLKNIDNPILLNLFIDEKINIVNYKSIFHNTSEQKVLTISCESLFKLINKKIDFLKFDIEGFEKFLFCDNFYLIKNFVKKFSGEFHFSGSHFPREIGYAILEKLKNDSDIEIKLFSLDGIDITNYFWSNKDFYTEIILSGIVK